MHLDGFHDMRMAGSAFLKELSWKMRDFTYIT